MACLRSLSDPSQVASLGVINPAATIPGSFPATTCCSLRRLRTPTTIISTNIGTIQSTYTAR
ncbi:Uncharacterised protein [Mycobacteroides abscessus subsp. abscessus]|nr:Uncharacterised protein [Mycobacteroides abscessus subsp. abscessus]